MLTYLKVVATDFPDKQLLDNIQHNMDHNLSDAARSHVEVQVSLNLPVPRPHAHIGEGYIWGRSTAALIREASKFSLIILSDLIFNHSQVNAHVRHHHESYSDALGSTMRC